MTSSSTGFSSLGSSLIFVGVNIKSKTSSLTQATWCQAFPFWASFHLVAKIPLGARVVVLSAPLPRRQAACLWIELKQSEHDRYKQSILVKHFHFMAWLLAMLRREMPHPTDQHQPTRQRGMEASIQIQTWLQFFRDTNLVAKVVL